MKHFAGLWRNPTKFLLPGGIAALFVALAGKIAFFSPYPLPYDEAYHFGQIRIYAQHLNPFLSGQPAGGDAYGAMATSTSYLYHYVMSFPLRVVTLFTQNEYRQVLAMRAIGIALGLLTLYLIYRLGRRLGLSRLGAQLLSLCIAITPVFYDVAAQVNYDTLLLPMIVGSVLLTLALADSMRQQRVSAATFACWMTLILAALLTQFSYMPIALALVVYVVIVVIRQLGVVAALRSLFTDFRAMSAVKRMAVGGMVLLALVMWGQRYGVDLVRYHSPHPNCSATLSAEHCSQYNIWTRNMALQQTAAERPLHSVPYYAKQWAGGMFVELYALTNHSPETGSVFLVKPHLVHMAKILVGLGVVCMVCFAGVFLRRRAVWSLVLLIGVLYLVSLWMTNYDAYQKYHLTVAVQGRYLLPVLAFGYGALLLGYEAAVDWVLGIEINRLHAALAGFIAVCWLAARRLHRIGQVTLQTLAARPVESVLVDSHAFMLPT